VFITEIRFQTLQNRRGKLAQPKKCGAYATAVCDTTDRTGAGNAPWTLVEANDKNFARIKILKTLCQQIEAAMKHK
jgi:AMP-polyphosphate phosphotransferase